MGIPRQDRIVGYWKGNLNPDGTLQDFNPNAGATLNHGALVSAPPQTETPYGSALDYDGSADTVTITDDSSLGITGAITLSCILQLQAAPGGQTGLLGKSDIGNNNRSYELNISSTSKLVIAVSSDGTADSAPFEGLTGNIAFGLGEWVHVVGTFDPSTSLILYVNGEIDATKFTNVPASLFSSNSNLQIASRNSSGSPSTFLNAIIGHCIIHNVALNPNEVKELYIEMERLTARR